jgi:hypothetical protein
MCIHKDRRIAEATALPESTAKTIVKVPVEELRRLKEELKQPTLRILSVAYWDERHVRLGNTWNRSDDSHDCMEAAVAVCRLLERNGFGGQRQFFPTHTATEVWYGDHRVEYHGWMEEEIYFDRRRGWERMGWENRVIAKKWGPKGASEPSLYYHTISWDPNNLRYAEPPPNGVCEVKPPHP